jgi:DNA-binding MarR family transcriptional regulator
VSDRALRIADRESATHQADKLELRVWLRLLACTNLIEAEVRTRLRESFSTTLPRFDLLAQLERAPEGLSMTALSSHLMVTGANVTALVDSLARDGLVQRVPHPSDRRSQVIRLTAKGRRFFNRMAPVQEQWIDEMMAGLEREEMAELFHLLGRLKTSARMNGSGRS